MAEAAIDKSSYIFLCPFCELSLTEYEFKAHVEEVHEVFKDTPVDELKSITKFVKAKCASKKEHYEGLFLTEKMKILKSVLRDNFPTYLENFKLWIRCEITRGQFDQEIQEFFNHETIAAHNEFLIDFMKEIRSISKGSDSVLMNVDGGESSSASHVTPENKVSKPSVHCNESTGSSLKDAIAADPMYISLKRTLPDFETIYSMVTASAWESDQAAANKAAVKLIHNVAEAIVRNILRTILLRRKNITVSKDGFIWDADVTNEKTSEEILRYTGEITLQELLDCLVAHPKLIPIKAVYNFTIRRVLNMIKKKSKTVPEEKHEDT